MGSKYFSATERQQAPPALHKISLQLHHVIKESKVHGRMEKKSQL